MEMEKGEKEVPSAESHCSDTSWEAKGEHHLVLACNAALDSKKKLELQRSRQIRIPGSIPIPKHVTTSGEKYVMSFVEMIHNYAVRGSSWNLSKVHACIIESESIRADVYDMASFLIKYPVVFSDDSISMIGDSRRMRKILNPLMKQYSCSANFSAGIREPVHFRYLLSSEPVVESGDYKSIPVSQDRFGSASSYKASSHPCSIQGTLQIKWKDGVPHHVFGGEDKKDVYTAIASNVDSSSDKALECVYTFYAGKRETIATMRVFTSITFRSNMEQIKETKFILYASSDDHSEEINLNNSNKSRLTRKMASVFRPGNFLRQRSFSRASVKSAVLEDSSTVTDDSEDDENNDLPSHEIAAIVLRETCHSPVDVDNGGWGLKFLKKPINDPSAETLEPSENTRNNGGCSTSMSVLIPAGIHGKSKAKSSGPSSLVDRWISRGGCDCGGWDIGCPLTVLVPKQSNSDNSSPGKCKPVHLYIEDSRQDAPVLKMENIRDGSYSINFGSMLSNLQSFAIAAAVIHSQNPALH